MKEGENLSIINTWELDIENSTLDINCPIGDSFSVLSVNLY